MHVWHIFRPAREFQDGLCEWSESVQFGLQDLLRSRVERSAFPTTGGKQVIFGAHLRPAIALDGSRPGDVIYNTEQVVAHGKDWMGSAYLQLLRQRTVWDFNQDNAAALSRLLGGQPVTFVPMGYHPKLTRIPKPDRQDIDVLFCGAPNERRQPIIDEFRASGLEFRHVSQAFGTGRDELVARAKVILGMHFYDAKVFEICRASYMLANAKAMVSEVDLDTKIEPDIYEAIVGKPADELVGCVHELVDMPEIRVALEQRGFEIFQKRDIVRILEQALQAP